MERLLNLEKKAELFVLLNTGINERLFDQNDTYKKLGTGIKFFHYFSRCNLTTALYKKSKNVIFKDWMASPRRILLSDAFQALSWSPSNVTVGRYFKRIYCLCNMYMQTNLSHSILPESTFISVLGVSRSYIYLKILYVYIKKSVLFKQAGSGEIIFTKSSPFYFWLWLEKGFYGKTRYRLGSSCQSTAPQGL